MLLAARSGAGQQRFGWIWPLGGLAAGCASYLLVGREDELAKVIAVTILAGWTWLCFQPSIRHKFVTIGAVQVNTAAINSITQSVQQGILFFSLPILVFSTQPQDPGQIFVTGFVLLAALVSTLDAIYEKFVARRQLPFIAFHCLCSFMASLIVLPIVIKVPLEKSFTVALLLVLLWLVAGAPLNRRHNEISLRVFIMALMFPLLAWSVKDHIPPVGITMEKSVMTNGIANHEPPEGLSRVSLLRPERGLYLHSSVDAPPGLSHGLFFDWHDGDYSGEIAGTTVGGEQQAYRSYALKMDFMSDAPGQWTVDIPTPELQSLDWAEMEVIPCSVYPSAVTDPRIEFSMLSVTGLVIKPSM